MPPGGELRTNFFSCSLNLKSRLMWSSYFELNEFKKVVVNGERLKFDVISECDVTYAVKYHGLYNVTLGYLMCDVTYSADSKL